MRDIPTILNELARSLEAVDEDELETFASAILSANTVFVDGFGRSGLVAKGFAMRLEHMGLEVRVVGDVTTPAIGPGDLLLVCSASGASQTLVYHAKTAASAGAKLLVVTSVADSTLVKTSAAKILIKAPTRFKQKDEAPSGQPMGSLFEQSAGLVLDAVVLKLMRAGNVDSESMFKRHANLE